MSVLYAADRKAAWLDQSFDWTCVECGQPVEPPAVYWFAAVLLLFHAECAARLGPHLIADGREASLAANPGTHWRRRLVSAARHRLVAEELVA